MKRKGFTLIELVVVIAIIGVLILFAMPKYREYTKEARLTKIKIEMKALEEATINYYMKYSDWPRRSDTPYTSEQLSAYSKGIYDKTGEAVELVLNGKYYDIDYSKLSSYIKEPEYPENYILQNPVGVVYYLDTKKEDKSHLLVESGKVQDTTNGFIFDKETGIIVDYIGGKKVVVVPESFNIDGELFEVKGLGADSFNSKNVEEVYLSKNISVLSGRCFYGNPNLRKLEISEDNPNYISVNNAIYTKDKEKLVIGTQGMSESIEKSVKAIGGHAFANKGITKLIIPDGVEIIHPYAFEGNNLVELKIPKSVNRLTQGFTRNPNLVRVEVDKDNPFFKSINNAIYSKDGTILMLGTKGMSTNIESSATRIRSGSFYGMGITSVYIPAGINRIDLSSFHFNPELVNVVVNSNNPNFKSVNNAIYSKDGLLLLVAGTKVMSNNIESTTKTIGVHSFYNMGLTSIVIPSGVTTINSGAFSGNDNLTQVTIGYNVGITESSISPAFYKTYIKANKSAGVYQLVQGNWIKR